MACNFRDELNRLLAKGCFDEIIAQSKLARAT